jgi:hypothetical protein
MVVIVSEVVEEEAHSFMIFKSPEDIDIRPADGHGGQLETRNKFTSEMFGILGMPRLASLITSAAHVDDNGRAAPRVQQIPSFSFDLGAGITASAYFAAEYEFDGVRDAGLSRPVVAQDENTRRLTVPAEKIEGQPGRDAAERLNFEC